MVDALKIALSFWRFWRVTVSSGGSRLSWSLAVSAAVSSCATVMIRVSLDAIDILMSYAGNHLRVCTMHSDDVAGNQMRWQW